MSPSTGRVAVGEEIQQWMSDPNNPDCDIRRTDLTWRALYSSAEWILHNQPMLLPEMHMNWMRKIGLLEDNDLHRHSESVYQQIELKNFFTGTTWIGRTGPGVIFLELLQRNRDSGDPFMSELIKAAYERDFDLDTLRYVCVVDIENNDTSEYIEEHIYKPEANIGDQGVIYPSEAMIFKGMLGTKFGKMVSYFLLGAYGQGVKHITQIHVFRADNAYQIQFKIEDVVGH
ncbi:hypothetical protein PENPOL_c010G03065 [Penicillium polonicum]|uniref:Uncharacterized protein n=1 Tax=Penicillium polonicum TaxID=60169 RepID=A0A1V6NFC8_PENPO|nr:hypothetical protein PENPOL_c010G03065 [Penicillium polonicum]